MLIYSASLGYESEDKIKISWSGYYPSDRLTVKKLAPRVPYDVGVTYNIRYLIEVGKATVWVDGIKLYEATFDPNYFYKQVKVGFQAYGGRGSSEVWGFKWLPIPQ